MDLFAGHENVHGTHGTPVRKRDNPLKWEIKSSAETIREPATVGHWEAHLTGKKPLGIVPVTIASQCWWGSIDIDQYDINLSEVIQRVEREKLPLVPCRSKSGGLHLFLFMSEPVSAGTMQAVLRDLAAQLGFAGSEIFPKQTAILTERGDVGNWMVMPYYGDTYGGKLKEQVGLRRTGAEMTLEDFLSVAERSRQTEEQLDTLGRRKKAERKKSGKKGAVAPEPDAAGDFRDGPPCLQHLSAQGVLRGGQSNALFMMGVYYKKLDPEGWKARLEKANQEFLKPPGSSEGLTTVIRSLEKKDYEYTCKNEPMVSHCNSTLCRTRKFGVGDGGNVPALSGLSKLDTEPPIWFADVGDMRIEATTEQLQNYTLFHRLCMDQGQCFAMLKVPEWLSIVSIAMESMTVVPAPPDVSTTGRFQELLEEFLTNRARGLLKDDLLSGRPWEDTSDENPELHRHYFRLSDLQKFLKREDMKELTRGQITQKIRKMGGGSHGHSIKNRFVSCWWVPSSSVNRMPELDPPPTPRSPI